MKAPRKPIIAIARSHPVLTGMFVIALAATAVFAVRTAVHVIYWSNPEHRALNIEGWMTLGYVAKSWDVPRDTIRDAIGTLPNERGLTLNMIAEAQGILTGELIGQLEVAIAAYHQASKE